MSSYLRKFVDNFPMKSLFIILFCGILLYSCSFHEKKEKTEPLFLPKHELMSVPVLPQSMEFCGVKINLQDEDIRERLDREVMVNMFYQSSTYQILKRANRFFPVIEKQLKKQGIHEDFKYLAVIESNLTQAYSPAGAVGFWQFMPVTAKQYGLEISAEVDERMDLDKSTIAACNYLKFAYDTLKDWCLAAASYNRGIGGVRSDMRWQGTSNYFDTHMNNETGRYVFRILAMKLIMENPEKYGYNVQSTELYRPYKIRKIEINKTINNLVQWAQEQGVNYKILIRMNPWILSNKLSIRKKHYFIQLPDKSFSLKPYNSY